MHRGTEVHCTILWEDTGWWPYPVHQSPAPSGQGPFLPSQASVIGHQAAAIPLAFFFPCKMWPDPSPSPYTLPSRGRLLRLPPPSLSSFFSCCIHIFLYLLQRSEKQINEEKDPIILRPDSEMGGGEGSCSIKMKENLKIPWTRHSMGYRSKDQATLVLCARAGCSEAGGEMGSRALVSLPVSFASRTHKNIHTHSLSLSLSSSSSWTTIWLLRKDLTMDFRSLGGRGKKALIACLFPCSGPICQHCAQDPIHYERGTRQGYW